MKSILTLVFSLLLVYAYAQVDSARVSMTPETLQAPIATVLPALPDSAKQEVFRKNIFKVNLSSFALYNNSLSYERSLGRKTSMVAGYRYMPEIRTTTAYLVKRATEKFGKEDEDFVEDLSNVIVGNNTFTGEIRFYAGKKPGARGFYLSAYGRYMNMTIAFPHEYETSRGTYLLPFDGRIKGFAGGLMIGSQWLIAKRVVFDWYILGGHYGKLKIDIPAVADLSTMSADDKNGLKEDIESVYSEVGIKGDIEASVTEQGADVKGNAPFPGLRGLGFSFGIAF